MKKIIFLVAVAIIGGVCIWSCSQDDELENGGSLYRYTDKELAEIRSLVEKYGLEDVEYPVESKTKLYSVSELEEVFKTFAGIKGALSMPLEMEDSVGLRMTYKTKPSFERLRMKRGAVTEVYNVTVHTYPARLTFTFDWVPNCVDGKVVQWFMASLVGTLELPDSLESCGYFYKDPSTTYMDAGDVVHLYYSCKLAYYDNKKGLTIAAYLDYTENVPVPSVK